MFNYIFSKIVLFSETAWYNVETDWPQMAYMTQYMYFTCFCITNAADKHSQYVIVFRGILLKILPCLSEATMQ